ncbi:RTA1 like protein-domain-containing protein [Xylariales sp. AK1849]|nr:RTA1 like protein-domain-containing protein [Xylariales sp. AK1849]
MSAALTKRFSFRDCSPDICPYERSYYSYRIGLIPNAVFLALFSLSFIGYLVVFTITRRARSFTTSMCLGVTAEILGYAGRIISWKNQWNENGFLMQVCCLTVGPAFMAAGIYFCLRRIVCVFGAGNSRLKPKMYATIFIPCDIISLVLQGSGGALASVASHRLEPTTTGDNIMIAGLVFQVATIVVFISLTTDFALCTLSRRKAVGNAALDQDPMLTKIRNAFMFKGYLVALALATLAILWRSVFRVAELSGGWTGPIMTKQGLFYGMEGALIIFACLILNIFHPSICFKQMIDSSAIGLG